MVRKKGYIFTNKRHTQKGIMSTILGILSNITMGTAIYLSYINKGVVSARDGTAVILAVAFMTIGMILGLWSTTEKEKFKLFMILGIVVNTLAFGMLSIILYAGAYID